MTTLPSYISDYRVDPFTGAENPRHVTLPTPTTPEEVHDCRFLPELSFYGIKIFEKPQPASGLEDPTDKFKLFQEDAPGSGNYTVEFLQINLTDEPSPGQYKVSWPTGTGILKMNAADRTEFTGRNFAVDYYGLGTINAALYYYALPPGSIIPFVDSTVLVGAWSLAEMRSLGWAVMNGETADSQGIQNPLITGALPDLVTNGEFFRSSATAGVFELDALQDHHHLKSLNHSHGVFDPSHGHQDHLHQVYFFDAGSNQVTQKYVMSRPTLTNQWFTSPTVTPIVNGNFPPNSTGIINTTPAVLSGGDASPSEAPGGGGPARVATETRPRSYSVIPLIKVK